MNQLPKYSYRASGAELYHHGIPKMKWGVRRYQNPDGSLTPEGKKRYSKNKEGDPSKTTEKSKGSKDPKPVTNKRNVAIATAAVTAAAGIGMAVAYKWAKNTYTDALVDSIFSEERATMEKAQRVAEESKRTLSELHQQQVRRALQR